MQHALRPYVTTSIAIVGASVIAVTPVMPSTPDVQKRGVALLTSGADILTRYEDLYTNTLEPLDQELLAHPFPVVTQIAENLTGYVNQLIADPQSISTIPGEVAAHLQSLTSLLDTRRRPNWPTRRGE